MLRSLLTAVAMSTFALGAMPAKADYQIDCSAEPGRVLCVEMRQIEFALTPCTGSGCTFGALANQLDRATEIYLNLFATSATDQAGNLAQDVSDKLCSSRFRGERSQIQRLQVSANRFLQAMAELQEIAGITDTRTCQLGE